jgi:hypothetical protein
MTGMLTVASLFFLVAPAVAQTRDVREITVQAGWGGLGPSGKSDLLIKREGDHYVANGNVVDETLVDGLIHAIEEPIIPQPTLENVGLGAAWLEDHVTAAGKFAYMVHYDDGSPAQKALFRSSFVDAPKAQRRLKQLYASFHTDDYPHLAFRVTFKDGTSVSVDSTSQHPFMIPWKIVRDGKSQETYNVQISRALQALLPEKFTNRGRLADGDQYSDGLLGELAGYTSSDIKTQWEALGAEQLAGSALESLKKHYIVRRSEVNSYHNLDYGKAWDGGEPHEENLQVDLWRPGLPPKVVVAGILLRQDGKVEGVEGLPEKSSRYERLVLSVGWLTKYWRDHPANNAWIFYIHDRSFSEKAMRIFAADMKEAGHENLTAKVRAVQEEAALVETDGGEYWIILPDRSAILWRWANSNHILGWKPSDFPVQRCTEYNSVDGGCSGATISPDGEVVSLK